MTVSIANYLNDSDLNKLKIYQVHLVTPGNMFDIVFNHVDVVSRV